jgi:hypothetical protein
MCSGGLNTGDRRKLNRATYTKLRNCKDRDGEKMINICIARACPFIFMWNTIIN